MYFLKANTTLHNYLKEQTTKITNQFQPTQDKANTITKIQLVYQTYPSVKNPQKIKQSAKEVLPIQYPTNFKQSKTTSPLENLKKTESLYLNTVISKLIEPISIHFIHKFIYIYKQRKTFSIKYSNHRSWIDILNSIDHIINSTKEQQIYVSLMELNLPEKLDNRIVFPLL